MNILERVKRLNIFARLAELEAKEKERDLALDLIILNLEHVEAHIVDRIKVIDKQNTRLNIVAGYNLDIKNDLDVS